MYIDINDQLSDRILGTALYIENSSFTNISTLTNTRHYGYWPNILSVASYELRPSGAEMAKENQDLTAAEKGKGKASEGTAPDGKKKEEPKKDKDGKPTINGKKGDEPEDGL